MKSACCEMRSTLPATLESIEGFFVDFRSRSACLAEKHRFEAELLLREALTNAVLHGCNGEPHRRVRCTLRLRGPRLIIVVGDDGNGFDWRTVLERVSDVTASSGRGFEILRRYATRVRLNRTGNVVTIHKRFNKENT